MYVDIFDVEFKLHRSCLSLWVTLVMSFTELPIIRKSLIRRPNHTQENMNCTETKSMYTCNDPISHCHGTWSQFVRGLAGVQAVDDMADHLRGDAGHTRSPYPGFGVVLAAHK